MLAPDRPRTRRIGRSLRALSDPGFRLYFVGQLGTQIAVWTQRVAQAWLVLVISDSPAVLGSVIALQFAPLLLLSFVSGSVADRLPKKLLLRVVYIALFAISALFAVLTLAGWIELWHIYVLALLFGLATAFERPAVQALLGLLVRPADLQSALGLDMSLFGTARIVSTTFAGIVIAVWGTGWCFLIAALAFLPMLIMLARISEVREPPRRPFAVRELGRDMLDGLSYVGRAPALIFPLLILAFIGLFGYNLSVVLPLLAKELLATGPAGFGLMQSAMGIGGLVGAISIASGTSPAPRTVVVSALLFGVLLTAVGASTSFLLTTALLVGMGLTSIVFLISSNTFLQARTDPLFRGRVMGLYVLLFSGVTPIGATFTGALAESWGIGRVVVLEGALCVTGALVGLVYYGLNRALVRRTVTPSP